MSDTFLDELGIGKQDERIIMPDRGVGRDIGRRPDFSPKRPETRSENRSLLQVGGYGRAEESIVSAAQRYVTFTLPISETRVTSEYVLAEGSGAISGINLGYYGSGIEFLCRVELVDGQTRQVFYRTAMNSVNIASASLYETFPGAGIAYNRLILRVTVERLNANTGELYFNGGTVYLASTE